MFRDAEKQFLSSLNNQKMVETFALLAKVYVRLDQPLLAIEQYKIGLEVFKNDVTLLTALARVQEVTFGFEMEGGHFFSAWAISRRAWRRTNWF
jgi:hypothetical protein